MTIVLDEALGLMHRAYLPEEARLWPMAADADRLFRHSIIRADDGARLNVFQAGSPSSPAILLVNALGMSVLFLAGIAKVLSRTHHVIAWETRGLPDATEFNPEADLSLLRHARDAACVIRSTGRTPGGILTYCSGVNVALRGLVDDILAAERLCIISPSIELPAPRRETDYQRTMLPIWRDVAERGLSEAKLIHSLLGATGHPKAGGIQDQLQILDRLPFRTAESTCVYANLQAGCRDDVIAAQIGNLDIRSLILHCRDDSVIHADTAAALAAALPNSSLQEINDCGHFGIFDSDEIHQKAKEFYMY